MTRHLDRYDRFQKDAVHSIVTDFEEQPSGRFLLVIPTGGGKTFTAVKAMNTLFERGLLRSDNDKVAWVAHRRELLYQAEQTFRRYETQYPDRPSCSQDIKYLMLSDVADCVARSTDTKIFVIDEAHHGAANSYQPIFGRQDLGVLGLTATPTRHDGRPLEFERESYSIGFPDLVELGVVLRPTVETVAGCYFEIDSITDQSDLERLNNKQRNARIIGALLARPDIYKKVIIYVGTRSHVTDLYEQISVSSLGGLYESVGWITGDGNSRDQDREDFLQQERGYKRSILINIQVLSEGYDDPSINTVVMASPTRSKLVYMQAMGRAIRHDPNDDLKQAYVIEVVDDLPNIRYRIDNRWLYADVSDALEPAVIDQEYATEEQLRNVLIALCRQYCVPTGLIPTITYQDLWRYSMLLFKVYKGPGEYFHCPLLITNANRASVSNMFNFLSERMRGYVAREVNAEAAFRMISLNGIDELSSERVRRYVFDAMANAASDRADTLSESPWITFVAFRFRQPASDLSPDLLNFLADMINRDEILARLVTHGFNPESVLIRLPLPLHAYVGKIVPSSEFEVISDAVDRLRRIKVDSGTLDHRSEVDEVLHHTVIPLEAVYGSSLATIAREDLQYSFKLK